MIRAIMHGCNGHMGQVITGLAAADEEIEIAKRIEEGLVTPTLAATPGDLSLVLPKHLRFSIPIRIIG